jgi:hypothetical protein
MESVRATGDSLTISGWGSVARQGGFAIIPCPELPAIGLLEAERAVHLGIALSSRACAASSKAEGAGILPRSHVTLTDPRRRHAEERLGALHALGCMLGFREIRPEDLRFETGHGDSL